MTVRDESNRWANECYVGLRPGEKLYEELFVGEDAEETAHPRIRMAKERFLPLDELQPDLGRLTEAIASGDAAAVRSRLRELIAPDQGRLRNFDRAHASA